MRALIVDSNQGRGALAAVRALGQAGWAVGIGCPTRSGLPMVSRWARHRHLIPTHASGESRFLEAIDDAIAAHRYELVFGCGDGEILTLSRERDKIAATIPYPPHETMVQAIDKVNLSNAARTVGLATPPEASSAAEAHAQWGPGPMIVKERLHGAQTASGASTHLAPEAYSDPKEIERRVADVRAVGALPVVQPLIDGKLMAFTSVIDEQGNMHARVQQVAERTYPLAAGLSVRARTVSVEEHLAAKVATLLANLGWFGLSELQFIQQVDGPPVLLDFNGRFYGSMSLALAAGVNLPDTWARLAIDGTPTRGGDARADTRYQWLEGDLRAARERSQGSLRDIGSCLRYSREAHAAIWSGADPLPGLLVGAKLVSQGTHLLTRGLGLAHRPTVMDRSR